LKSNILSKVAGLKILDTVCGMGKKMMKFVVWLHVIQVNHAPRAKKASLQGKLGQKLASNLLERAPAAPL
jgi:hypothetical protein